MTDFTIEDLRLPCKHNWHGPGHADDGLRQLHTRCPGGRVPTQAEIIDMLGGRPVVRMGGLSPAFYLLEDEDDEPDGYVVPLGDGT